MTSKRTTEADGRVVITEVLHAAAPRPADNASIDEKIRYAVRFADAMAHRIAKDLAPLLRGIQATTQRSARSEQARKQLDVNFSTPEYGLALGISLKSVHIRDQKNRRYTHNMKRNEEELRIEASGYHKRQPYAVMIGSLFLPFDSCEDAKTVRHPSSFGSWVKHLRPYCGRSGPKDDADRFEKLYIGLYELDGSDLAFFDVQAAPPKHGRPGTLMTYADFLSMSYHEYLHRNMLEFAWAEGEEEPLGADETY
ncbi:MAG: hypothetical protein WBX15_20340 [Thermoanaerobaculia bacterium]